MSSNFLLDKTINFLFMIGHIVKHCFDMQNSQGEYLEKK
jgi:hypothetical protein